MSFDLWFSDFTSPTQKLSLKIKETLFRGRSDHQEILVVDTYDFGRVLVLDDAIQTTERDEWFYHEMIAHVPLMAHPAPRRVLVVGGGDGGTVREVLRHPGVEQVTMVEIDAMVVEQARRWLPGIAGRLDDPRVDLRIEDAVAFMPTCEAAYDVILIDSSDPVGPGEGLFSETFYRDARKALKPGGLLVAQTESPVALEGPMRRAYRNMYAVFPRVETYLGLVPTYSGQLWSFSFCSEGLGPDEAVREADFAALEPQLKYYNRDVHRAAFLLPTFVKQLLAGARPTPAH